MALWQYNGGKALYHLDGNANDSSGNWYNGTATNIVWVDGKIGSGCASGNWTNSNITSATWLGIAVTNYTISVWVKPNSIPTWNDFWEIFGAFNAASQYVIWLMIYQQKWYAFHWIGWAQWIIQPSTPIPASGNWYNVTIVGSNKIELYVNGVLIWSTWSWLSATINSFSLFHAAKLNGLIDEFVLATRAWSAQEVKKYYTMSKWRFWIL